MNPWATGYDLIRGRRPAGRPLATYPARWGVAPAVLAFVSLAAMELAWSQSEVPRSLALAILGYSVFTWLAMVVFGRDQWLARGGSDLTSMSALCGRTLARQGDRICRGISSVTGGQPVWRSV